MGKAFRSDARAGCVALATLLAACRSAPDAPAAPAAAAVAPDADERMRAVHALVDDWHAAASRADAERYLACFAPDAVFLGTDATERWTLAQFAEYVHLHFPRGGWTYHPHDRVVQLSADGELAWFDEGLGHASYGELRGTGVLRRAPDGWRIVHYSMTFTIPNAVARRVVEVVRTAAPER